jgi:hypothetical protein
VMNQSMLPSVATTLNLSESIPTVEQDALGFDFLGKNRIDNHVGKMIVLGLPILLRHINNEPYVTPVLHAVAYQ